ncbi:hypothetical protein CEQ90_10755 [Lewinellaceae bacterium SD302]|nr:hypothetical protein CEQ90_10755 [Lewinellaceae bacterium SD302]
MQLSFGDPIVAKLEKERKVVHQKVKKLWQQAGLSLLALVLLTIYLFTEYAGGPNNHYFLIGVGITVAGLIAALIFWAVLSERFRKKFQFKILPIIAEQVWPGVRWYPDGLLPMEVLREAELVSAHDSIDRYDGKHLFEGEFAGLPIEMSEVHAQERRTRTKDGKTETYHATIFNGIVLRAERYGHPGVTRLSYRDPGWGLNVQLPGWFSGMASRPEIQFGTNDPNLGKRFTLEGDEPEAGRALVTEELLVTLQKLKNSGNGVPTVVLTPLHLYIALRGESFTLAPSYREPIHQQATVSHQYQELQHLLRVVELLAQEPKV